MTGLRCVEVVEQVTDFVEAALDADDMRRIIDHLPHCEGCRRYVEQVLQTIRLLRRAGDVAGWH